MEHMYVTKGIEVCEVLDVDFKNKKLHTKFSYNDARRKQELEDLQELLREVTVKAISLTENPMFKSVIPRILANLYNQVKEDEDAKYWKDEIR